MSPLGFIILRFLQYGVGFCAASLGVFLAALIWDRWLAAAPGSIGGGGWGVLVIVAVCFAGSLWLLRAISRELKALTPRA
jgi:uncharacterized membrane protein YedE/YeeE